MQTASSISAAQLSGLPMVLVMPPAAGDAAPTQSSKSKNMGGRGVLSGCRGCRYLLQGQGLYPFVHADGVHKKTCALGKKFAALPQAEVKRLDRQYTKWRICRAV